MMRRLIFDVTHRWIYPGNSYAERAITFLPRKRAKFGKRLANPFGRVAFEKLCCFGDRKGGRQRDQDVDMVACTADSERLNFILLGDATQVRPEPFA